MAACPDCGGKMSGMADMCPHCGFMMKHKQVLKQKQKSKQRQIAGKCFLIGGFWLVYGAFMSVYHVSWLFCLIPFVLSVYYIGRSFLAFIGFVQ